MTETGQQPIEQAGADAAEVRAGQSGDVSGGDRPVFSVAHEVASFGFATAGDEEIGVVGGGGRSRSRRPLSQSFSASQWMPPTTFRVRNGTVMSRRSKRRIGEGDTPGEVAGGEDPPLRVVDLDHQREGLGRGADAEAVAEVHVEEGRDVEGLVAALADFAAVVALDRDQVGVALAEGVVDLPQDRRQGAVAAVAEEHRQRIEGPAEDPRHGEQPDRPAVGGETGGAHRPLDLSLEIDARPVAAIAGEEGGEIEAIDREEAEPAVEIGQLVEIDQHRPDAIGETMLARPQPMMGDVTRIEGGTGGRGHSAASVAGATILTG